MSLREKVVRAGPEISPRFIEGSYPRFAPAEETMGFFDTSAKQNGSRGIAFLCDRIRVKQSKTVWQAYYTDITQTFLCESYVDGFSDELVIRSIQSELRITDYSLNKRELKALIDELCAVSRNMSDETLEQEFAAATLNAAEHFSQIFEREETAEAGDITPSEVVEEEPPVVLEQAQEDTAEEAPTEVEESSSDEVVEEEQPVVSEQVQEDITEEAPAEVASGEVCVEEQPVVLEQLQEDFAEEAPAEVADISSGEVCEEEPPVVSEQAREDFVEEAPFFEFPTIPEVPAENSGDGMSVDEILEELDRRSSKNSASQALSEVIEPEGELIEPDVELDEMTHEETMSYLLSSISEINTPNEDKEEFDPDNVQPDPAVLQTAEEAEETPQKSESETPPEKTSTAPAEPSSPFTKEPNSADIYIKASRRLREACEAGKLSRGEIRAEIKTNLLNAAQLFTEITADKAALPENLAKGIDELKASSQDLSVYFDIGEDVAERVMFYMMFQMLAYSDMISHSAQTSERLRRFLSQYEAAELSLLN